MNRFFSLIRWGVGGLFFFFCFCVLFVCFFVLPKQRTFSTARFLFKRLIRLMGIRLIVEGKHHIIDGKSYLIMGNHQSLFDIFVVPAAIPLCFTGLEAAYHFSIPVWGYLIRKWGCIPVERKNLKKAIQSLETAREVLLSGMSIAVLPEGHRTLDGKMGPFKKGPFHLAKAAEADILPFGVSGLFDFHPKGRLNLKPGIVTVTIGRQIPFEDIKDLSVEELRDLCFNKICKLCRESQ